MQDCSPGAPVVGILVEGLKAEVAHFRGRERALRIDLQARGCLPDAEL